MKIPLRGVEEKMSGSLMVLYAILECKISIRLLEREGSRSASELWSQITIA